MSGKPRPKGNAAWRRLSDEIPDDVVARHVEALGVIREALDGGVIDVQYVAASLRVLSGDYPCPHCLERPVAPRDTRAGLSGICEVCHKRRQRDGHLERLAEIEVTREVNVGKQQIRRARIAAGLPRPRTMGPTPEPVDEEETLREQYGRYSMESDGFGPPCTVCGAPTSTRATESLCAECAERQERRAAARGPKSDSRVTIQHEPDSDAVGQEAEAEGESPGDRAARNTPAVEVERGQELAAAAHPVHTDTGR